MKAPGTKGKGGFTLVEALIAVAISTVVLASAWGLFLTYVSAQGDLTVQVEANRIATMALSRMVYGVGGANTGLRAAAAVEMDSNADGWELRVEDQDGLDTGTFEYEASQQALSFRAPDGRETRFAQSISWADAQIQSNAVVVSLRVDLRRGRHAATQELSTAMRWRN